MYPTQITQNGDSWHVLTMESENAVGLGVEVTLLLSQGDGSVMFMLTIIGCGDFGQ